MSFFLLSFFEGDENTALVPPTYSTSSYKLFLFAGVRLNVTKNTMCWVIQLYLIINYTANQSYVFSVKTQQTALLCNIHWVKYLPNS